jgi:hypothetical protein
VRNGRLVFEYYREGLGPLTLHDMRSATMCVVSTLVGIALQKGLIRSVNQPIADFLPEALGEDVDSRVKAMTLGHILTMTAGFDPAAKQVGKWAFPVDFALRRSLVSDPGTTFSFNPGESAGERNARTRIAVRPDAAFPSSGDPALPMANRQARRRRARLQRPATHGKRYGEARSAATAAWHLERNSAGAGRVCRCGDEEAERWRAADELGLRVLMVGRAVIPTAGALHGRRRRWPANLREPGHALGSRRSFGHRPRAQQASKPG